MNQIKCIQIIIPVLLALVCLSCTPMDQDAAARSHDGSKEAGFAAVHERAADNLIDNCRLVIDSEKPIIVTSLVDIDQMGKSSTLGRMSSEMIAARLAQKGFRVREVKMSQSDIFVSEDEGEFILSRNLRLIGERHNVQGFVVGTYAIGRFHRYDVDVYISLRFVNTEDIIACSENYIVYNTDPKLWK